MAKRIAILIFERFSLCGLSEIAEVFRLANEVRASTGTDFASDPDDSAYSLTVLSSAGGSVESTCSMRVWSDSLDVPSLDGFDALFIVSGPGAQAATNDESLIRRLRTTAARARVVKAIGTGSEILAAADLTQERCGPDLLTGARVASPLVQQTLPAAADQPLAPDDPLGPIAAALSVVKRDYGSSMAREISERSLPGAWRRLRAVLGDLDEGGPYDKVNAAVRWIGENYRRPISVSEAACAVNMSERSFLRRFKTQVGLTPSEYLLRTRIDASCTLLVSTDLPVDEIARRCGVGSGDRLAKIFRNRLSISPTEYRATGRRKPDHP